MKEERLNKEKIGKKETEDLRFLYFAISWLLADGFPILYFEASSHRNNMVSYSLYEYDKKYILYTYIYIHINIHIYVYILSTKYSMQN